MALIAIIIYLDILFIEANLAGNGDSPDTFQAWKLSPKSIKSGIPAHDTDSKISVA
jgi:hypothetical protein